MENGWLKRVNGGRVERRTGGRREKGREEMGREYAERISGKRKNPICRLERLEMLTVGVLRTLLFPRYQCLD